MGKYYSKYMRNFDYGLLFVYIFLCIFGLVMIYSSSMFVAIVSDGEAPNYYYKKQLINLAVACLAFVVVVLFPYHNYRNKSILKFLAVVMVVLEVWLFTAGIGKEEVGSQSWIRLFGLMTFQPSEYAKLFVILYFAGVLYNKSVSNRKDIQRLTVNDIKFPTIAWVVILGCVAAETDIGAVLLIFSIALGIFVASGMRGKILLKFSIVLGFFGSIAVAILLLIKRESIFNESRLGRFTSYRNPFEYAEGSGYQVINGYYAIGSGGIEGKGLGQSVQKLGYLPEPQTDFILAIIAEELGVFGVTVVLLGIGYIVLRGLWIAMTTKDPHARMIAAGISTWIGLQTFVNVGGLSGIIPLTGVTLPFISYGGTSILLLSVAMGILINVSVHHKIERKQY
ncbi:MAG: FtsW/RodA/SpoVE family cell cycle protein [Solibacillus sp.]